MNKMSGKMDGAQEALALLRAAMQAASPEEQARLAGDLAGIVDLRRDYPAEFTPDADYLASMPDLQNGPAALIRGAHVPLQHVGIAGFRLPIRFERRAGGEVTLDTRVTGTVDLEASKKGINMSRIMRSFYDEAEALFSVRVVEAVLDRYKRDLESLDARVELSFSYPMRVESLRSGLSGYQYYDISIEVLETAGVRRRFLHLDYVYSSTCPCSLELAEHARAVRGQLATPHSQRSVARVSVEMKPGAGRLWFEDLIEACRRAVPTETQVMVKREDEQAFAELNAANPIFVEDAVRLFCDELRQLEQVGDSRVIASHQESLHSHDAISVLTEGPTFEAASLDPKLFTSLVHK
ncbi:MAG: GTP cyclohydrolase I FolE2 [Rhodobacterales bacterium]|nr:MAG: GTP cyclohydrolase I FolE2 [Rhodobacterales bacterium]